MDKYPGQVLENPEHRKSFSPGECKGKSLLDMILEKKNIFWDLRHGKSFIVFKLGVWDKFPKL